MTGAPSERFLRVGVDDRGPQRAIFARWGGEQGPLWTDIVHELVTRDECREGNTSQIRCTGA
jgi:hypothetical protein